MDSPLDVIIDIPCHRQEIVSRGPIPAFCRVTKKVKMDNDGSRCEASHVTDSEVAVAFYKIARPEIPDDDEEPFVHDLGRVSPEPIASALDSALSPAEEEIVVEIVKEAGETGIDVGDSGRFLVWRHAAPRGFGQTVARVSGQLSLKKPNTAGSGEIGWTYPPICTYPGCRSSEGARVDEQNPTCLKHKGPNTGFCVLEYGTFDRNGVVSSMDHRILSFTYTDGQKDEHLTLAIQKIRKPTGQEQRRLVFEDREEAEQTFSVWQTAFLFQKLRNPLLQYHYTTISLAIGLEREVKEELRRVGLELRLTMLLTSKSESKKIEFPFGRRAKPQDKFSDLITANDGALYVAADPQFIYGGQTVRGSYLHPEMNGVDTISKYKAEFNHNVKIIPIASVPKGVRSANLKKMESHLHVGLYMAYLFRLRNHLDQELNLTHPYSLNKETTSCHFDGNSRELIQRFVLKEFGAFVEILPCRAYQFII